MDTDDLSDKTYDAVMLTAEKFNNDLTVWLGCLASECKNEAEYLSKAEEWINDCLEDEDIDDLMEDLFFGNPPSEKDFKNTLLNILKNIEKIKKRSVKRLKRGYVKHVKTNDDVRKKVFVLGSLHGYMFRNPDYSMLDFQKAIISYKPTHILTEVRSEYPGPVEGSIDGGFEQSLVYAIADKLGVKVIAVDWFDDELLKEDIAESSTNNQAYEEEMRDIDEEIIKHATTADMLFWNSPEMGELMRNKYQIEEKHGFMSMLKRNKKICENIKNALEEITSGRILIIFGAAHKYYFDDYLNGNDELELLTDMSDWFDSEIADEIIFDEDINVTTINNLKESKELLRTRLESGFYPPEIEKRLEGKYQAFDRVIDNFQKLGWK